VAGIAVYANAAGTTEGGWSLNDSWLTAKTKFGLWTDARVKVRQVEVKTMRGVVTLHGTVDSEEARQASEDITKEISGVQGVTNLIEVAISGASKPSAQEDDAITAQIKDHIMTDLDHRLKEAVIGVRTTGGIVLLNGEVPDLSTSEHASWTAWKTLGVRDVKNDLTVKKTI
jgi:hyperosmotically inducible protein